MFDHPKEALQLSRIAAAAWSVIRLGQTQCWYPNSCFCDVVDVRQGRGSEESEEEASISAPPVAATLPVSSPQQNILHPRLLLDYGLCGEGRPYYTLPFIGLPADPLLELSPYTVV